MYIHSNFIVCVTPLQNEKCEDGQSIEQKFRSWRQGAALIVGVADQGASLPKMSIYSLTFPLMVRPTKALRLLELAGFESNL